MYKGIYHKNLAHVIMDTGKSKIYSVDQQYGSLQERPRKADAAVSVKMLASGDAGDPNGTVKVQR